MLGKHVLGYIPSNLIPALTAFGAVYCYTRLLSPEDYGHFALALNSMTLLNAVFFTWLQTSLPRLMPEAVREGKAAQLRATTYAAFIGMSAVMVLCALLFIGTMPLGSLTQVAWLAVPLALARAFLNMNQAFHRSALNFRAYNLIECGQAVLGFGIGLALVYFLQLGNLGATSGMIIGMACMALVDLKQLRNLAVDNFSLPMLRTIMKFGLPLTLSYGFAFIISTSDRFMIEYFQGAGAVGIYAAGFTLMDRIATIIFMMVALPAFPLTIYKLEHEGHEAARDQTYANGVAMLALALPACVGLILTNAQLGTVFIGESFRAGALQIMPWIACSAILNGMATHYFDHAFHLAKKPYLLLFTQGPAALFNLAANLYLIPKYGYMGAVYANVASYIVLLTLSIVVGRRAFPVKFPFKPALQIAAAVGVMALVLTSVPFSHDFFGLVVKVAVGGVVYAAGILALNVMDSRARLILILRKSRVP
mgnify:CR=1 FL=1